jgi:glycosyltransferase involved in cell wall biosynthesis
MRDDRIIYSVIIPAYQEEATIVEALALASKVLFETDSTFEIILVCDGENDNTYLKVKNLSLPRVSAYSYPINRGKGYAIRFGASLAKGEYLIFLDADLDLDPHAVLPLLNLLHQYELDLVIGSKIHKDSIVNYPLFRRILSRTYRLLIKALFNLNITDTQTGLKVCKASSYRSIEKDLQTDGFAFDLELIVAFYRENLKISEGPVILNYKFDSSVNILSALKMLAATFRIYRKRLN